MYWAIFASTYIGAATVVPAYIPAAAIVLIAIGLRAAARLRMMQTQKMKTKPKWR